MATALRGYLFEPSPEMLQKRFVDNVAEIVGKHVYELAKQHMTVTQVGDEIILELGKPFMDVIVSLYGQDLLSILAPNAMIKLPGWRKPDQCAAIPEAQTVSVPLPQPIFEEVEEEVKPKVAKARPRSRRLWQGD